MSSPHDVTGRCSPTSVADLDRLGVWSQPDDDIDEDSLTLWGLHRRCLELAAEAFEEALLTRGATMSPAERSDLLARLAEARRAHQAIAHLP